MENESRRISYFRTLIFTITAAIFSLILCGLLYFKEVRDYLVFIVVLEIGIFSIIGYCIYAIVNRERLMNELKDPSNYTISFDSCPDYYVKRYDAVSKKHFCSNEYVVRDNINVSEKVIMKIVDEKTALPTMHSDSYMGSDPVRKVPTPPEPSDKFLLSAFYNPLLKTNQDKCNIVDENMPEKPTDVVQGFKALPWTSVKARCNGLYGKV
jgi:hypothetical protein